MLSRVANNLYWMGRYLERSEHLARYTKVQYFSMYDAPNLQNKNFTLRSIIHMTGIEYDTQTDHLDEQDIILKVGLDPASSASIYTSVFNTRENARSSKNMLSEELWEMVNTYYRFVQSFPDTYFKTRGLYEFTQEVNRHCYSIKSCINQTLIHEFVWAIINLGIYIERIIQILRTIRSKLTDIEILSQTSQNGVLQEYQWTTTLKILNAFDIYKRYYKNQNAAETSSDFILFHRTFPWSILYNLRKIYSLADRIPNWESGHEKLIFFTGKLYNKVKYTTSVEVGDLKVFCEELLIDLNNLNELVTEEFFE
ncbi:alpha-E domain-containing protein [Membranihabitans marinus]|uniref:alpha-E domain-containing protein n=1 Tax=Membranihabitans marinus TaxID=1227546 RepID=UPI001F45D2A5|nr:alpha-E domain-containing protein [Membranihabitans marinus]